MELLTGPLKARYNSPR